MKKNIIKLATAVLLLMCGTSASAQINLGDILGGLSGKSSSSDGSSTSDLISGLTSIFSSNKQASEKNIVGTWTYDSPAIVFESDDLISKAGAAIASKKIESKLQTTLAKYGITEDKFVITFNEDGTFTESIRGKSYSGKWEVKDQKLVLNYSLKKMEITTQKEGNKLMFVTDATKLLSLMQSLGAKTATSSSLSTITSLMKNIKGMKVGLALKKK